MDTETAYFEREMSSDLNPPYGMVLTLATRVLFATWSFSLLSRRSARTVQNGVLRVPAVELCFDRFAAFGGLGPESPILQQAIPYTNSLSRGETINYHVRSKEVESSRSYYSRPIRGRDDKHISGGALLASANATEH